MYKIVPLIFILICLAGCSAVPTSSSYREFYAPADSPPTSPSFTESPYYLVFLVEARHLDYTDPASFLRTLAKHPSDGSKNGDVGHAWIYLKGEEVLEGGQSGETGWYQPRYWEGVLDNIALGSRNPASYLFCNQCDGFFQEGNGGHWPTFAAKVNISKDEYEQINAFIASYPFQEYSLTERQCGSFVREIAHLVQIELQDEVSLAIPSTIWIREERCTLWEDERYSGLKFSSPDRIEMSLMQLVREGKGEAALPWYQKIGKRAPHKVSACQRWERMQRYWLTRGVKS